MTSQWHSAAPGLNVKPFKVTCKILPVPPPPPLCSPNSVWQVHWLPFGEHHSHPSSLLLLCVPESAFSSFSLPHRQPLPPKPGRKACPGIMWRMMVWGKESTNIYVKFHLPIEGFWVFSHTPLSLASLPSCDLLPYFKRLGEAARVAQASTTIKWQSQETQFCSFWLQSLGEEIWKARRR